MWLVSDVLNGYYRFRLKKRAYRKKIFAQALGNELRDSKLGVVLLRNLNDAMAKHPELHAEFSELLNEKDYQTAFWESDLGYLWYQGNLNTQNTYFRQAIDIINKHQFKSVLDVGCGWGEFVSMTANCKSIERAVGIDISENIINEARKIHHGSRAVFEFRDVLHEQNTFDLVTLFGSSDYIPPEKFREVLRKVLTITNKEAIIVNSLRKIPIEESLHLKQAREIKRYDTGYVQPLNYLLTELRKEFDFDFTIDKAGLDSVWVTIRK